MNRISHRLMTAALLVLTSTFVAAALVHAQTAKGDQWETTSQMSMEGMPMQLPPTTVKVCSAKDWKEPPAPADRQRNCKNANMKTVGNTITWDVQCTGPTMTGAAEIIRQGTDSYTGSIKFAAPQGAMTIKLTGRKIGECDNPQ